MNKEYWIKWWKCAGLRACRTFAQSMIAVIPVEVSVTEVSWFHVIGVATLASMLSLLMSIAGLPELETEENRE